MKKIKDNIDLKELEKRGFKYNKYIRRYVLVENAGSINWNKMILEVSEDRMVKSCGTSIDYEKEIKVIEDIIEDI